MAKRSEHLNCLLCFDSLRSSGKRIKLPNELGSVPAEVFQKVCEVLLIPIDEIRNEWDLEGMDLPPFCYLCSEGIRMMVKLRNQLADINRKIETQISQIKEAINRSESVVVSFGDQKTISFRSRVAGNTRASNIQPTALQIRSPEFPQTTPGSFTTSWNRQVENTNTNIDLNTSDAKAEYFEDNTNDDDRNSSYSSGSDNETDLPSASLPPITRHVPVSEAFPFLPPHPPRANPFSKLARASETFSPVVTDDSGKMIYEGIQIIPVSNGYQCGQCSAVIGKDHSSISMRKTKIHMKGFHLGGYKCSLCAKDFTSADILLQHLNRSHTPRPVLPCAICGREMKYFSLKEHMYTHMNAAEKALAIASGFKLPKKKCAKLPCRICGKLNRSPAVLKAHEMTHVDAKFRKDYECPHCQKKFAYSDGLKTHIDTFHNDLCLRKKLCNVCGESIPLKIYRLHLKNHSKRIECKYCRKLCKPDKLNEHQTKCEEKGKKVKERHQCDICNQLFNSRKYLRLHQKLKHKDHWLLTENHLLLRRGRKRLEPKPSPIENEEDDHVSHEVERVNAKKLRFFMYEVEKSSEGWKCECGVTISGDEESVKCHIQDWHLGAFKCSHKCGKTFKNFDEAAMHARKVHEERDVFPCTICGAPSSKKTIQKHAWSHKSFKEALAAVNDGERLPKSGFDEDLRKCLPEFGVAAEVTCQICSDHGFTSVEALFQHRCDKHPDAPTKRVGRRPEPQKRGRKSKSHRMSKNCSICGKQFASQYKAKRHMIHVHRHSLQDELDKEEFQGDQDTRKEAVKVEVESEEDSKEKMNIDICIKDEVFGSGSDESNEDLHPEEDNDYREKKESNQSHQRESMSRRSSKRQSNSNVCYAENDSDD